MINLYYLREVPRYDQEDIDCDRWTNTIKQKNLEKKKITQMKDFKLSVCRIGQVFCAFLAGGSVFVYLLDPAPLFKLMFIVTSTCLWAVNLQVVIKKN